MKKQLIVLLALALVASLALAGCGGGDASAPVSEPAPEAEATEGSVGGTVIDATMNTITIQAPSGSEYTFATEGAQINAGSEGIVIGDEATVHYTGVFDDTAQVQDVTVTSIDVTAAEVVSTPEADTAAAPTDDVKVFEGVIDEYDGGDTMMVADATGVDYLFPLEGADLHVGEEGFAVGDNVEVYYYGELVTGPDLQNVTVGEVKKAD